MIPDSDLALHWPRYKPCYKRQGIRNVPPCVILSFTVLTPLPWYVWKEATQIDLETLFFYELNHCCACLDTVLSPQDARQGFVCLDANRSVINARLSIDPGIPQKTEENCVVPHKKKILKHKASSLG